MFTDVQTATATSLASIVPPTTVAFFSCVRYGLVKWSIVPFLVAGASVTSYFAAKYAAIYLTKEQQKACFVATMALLGGRMLFVSKIQKKMV